MLQIIKELSRLNLKEQIKSFNVTLLSVFVFLMFFLENSFICCGPEFSLI